MRGIPDFSFSRNATKPEAERNRRPETGGETEGGS